MKKYSIAYITAAVLDDIYTFYMVGIKQALTELNPVNKIVEHNPWVYLAFQAVKEPICLLVLLLVSVLFYYSFYRINRKAAAFGSKLILVSGILARWLPVIHNFYAYIVWVQT